LQKTTLLEISNKLKKIDVGHEPVIFLHSSLFQLGRLDCDIGDLLGMILDWVGGGGTLVMPSFSYHNDKNNPWFALQTPGKTGILTEKFRAHPAALRSIHPIHSVTAVGKFAEFLTGDIELTSFGEKSPFAKLIDMNALNIALGAEFIGGATFLHFIEEKFNVPYREFINLGVTAYNLKNDKVDSDFLYYGRKAEIGSSGVFENDWTLPLKELKDNRLFHFDKIGSANLMWSRMGGSIRFLSKKLINDPYYCAKKLTRRLKE
jgi:aminoglycoside 3-N-acetyltransferase